MNKHRLVCYLAQSRRSPSGYSLVFIISVNLSRVLNQASVFSVSTLLSLSLFLSYKKRHLNLCKHQRFMDSFVCLD